MRATSRGNDPLRVGSVANVRSVTPRIVFGLVVIALGVLFTLDNLGVIDAGEILRWWPALLLGYGLVRLTGTCCRRSLTAGVFFTLLGALLLLREFGVVRLDPWDFWPVLLIAFGGSMLTGALRRARGADAPVASGADSGSTFSQFVVWSGIERKVTAQDFRGGDVTAIMGGAEIDLRPAKMPGGRAVVDVTVMWGGVELYVPADWQVTVEALPLMAGIEDATRAPAGEVRGHLGNLDWLFEQCDVKFDLTRTKIAPLQSGGRTAGVIVFELRHPVVGDIGERFGPAARLGGLVLDMLETIGSQQWYAERFAQALSKTPDARHQTSDIRPQTQDPSSLRYEGQAPSTGSTSSPQASSGQAGAMAEMAAGAAHELNNPLSVISGRAQLLAKSETDPDRKRILEQIQQNAGELSGIIDDLMSYANPEQPRPTETAVRQIINDAIDLTKQKKQISQLDIKIDISPDTPNAFVDSAQIACAISNILCNGLESYASGPSWQR